MFEAFKNTQYTSPYLKYNFCFIMLVFIVYQNLSVNNLLKNQTDKRILKSDNYTSVNVMPSKQKITLDKNFFDLISSRHSVRAFKNIPIPEDKINTIINASTKGPSAGNLQSYQIFIVSKISEKEKLAESAHGQNYICDAPIVLIFCADPIRCNAEYGSRGEQLFSIQDATIACVYSQLAAHNLELSSVWIGSFDEEKVRNILKLKNDLKPVAILPIGFSNETPEITTRKPIDQIIHKI
jgi:nitroreductase